LRGAEKYLVRGRVGAGGKRTAVPSLRVRPRFGDEAFREKPPLVLRGARLSVKTDRVSFKIRYFGGWYCGFRESTACKTGDPLAIRCQPEIFLVFPEFKH
jgi:hypothetical protein